MNKDELSKLLNLKPAPTPQPTLVEVDYSPGAREGTILSQKSPSPYALVLDMWDQERGSKLLRHNHHARETKLSGIDLSDLHGCVFLSNPTLEEGCESPRKSEYIQGLLESPDYLALHPRTEHDPTASELATVEFAKAYAKLKEEDDKREKENEEKRKQGKSPNPVRDQLKKEMVCSKAITTAIKQADKEVEEYEETRSALGCGKGVGTNEKLDVSKIAALFKRTKDTPVLRSIMQKAGRYRRVAQSKQRQKQTHGYDDMVGVVLDGDVGRLLPHELAQIVTPEFELDAMRRLVERQSMCRQYRGIEKVGKGPIVVCVDESGSMYGEPLENAKAFALSMAYIARHQNRWCALVGYSGGTEGTRLVLPPSKWDESALLDWLGHDFGGGTDMDIPLDELPHKWWPEFVQQGLKRGKTDLILLTDAIVRVPLEMEKKFNAWKQKEQVKCTSLILQSSAGDLVRVSDEVHLLGHIGTEVDAIVRCLSI